VGGFQFRLGKHLSDERGLAKYLARYGIQMHPSVTERRQQSGIHPKTLIEMWIICLDPVSANSEKGRGSEWAVS